MQLTGWCIFSVCMLSPLQSRLTLWDPMDCSSPGSSVHGILQARILECVAMPFSRGSPWPRDLTSISYVSCTGKQPPEVKWKLLSHVRLFVTPWTTQSRARILEWVAISFSRGSYQRRDQTHISCIAGRSLPAEPPGGRPIWEAPDFLHTCCLTAITMSALPGHLHSSSQYNFLSLSTLDNFT